MPESLSLRGRAFASLVLAVLIALLWPHFVSAEPVTVAVDGSKKHQTIEGFGTCLISWGKYPGETYTDEFVEWYANTVGLNMLRESVDGLKHPEVADPSDIKAETITPSKKGDTFDKFAKQLKQINPDARIIATVWSPPSWMKLNKDDGNGTRGPEQENRAIRADSYKLKNGEESQNRVDPEKYEHFVQWLVAIADYHEKNGFPLYGISPANEPRFSQWYGSCIWTGEDLATVIAMLGKALKEAGHEDILIYAPEDMTGHLHAGGTVGMINAIAENPEALAAVDRFASHGYTDGVQMDTSEDSSRKFWDVIRKYGKPYWMTEGGTGGHDWPAPIENGLGMAIHNSLVGGNASAFVPWQISEPKASGHAIAIGQQVTPKTAAGMQYFRTVPIGSQRVEASPAFGPVQVSAFYRESDGKMAVVLINTTDKPQEVDLALAGLEAPGSFTQTRTSKDELFEEIGSVEVSGGKAKLELPPSSITSLAN